MKYIVIVFGVFTSSLTFAIDPYDSNLYTLQQRLKWATDSADMAGRFKKRADEFDVRSERAASRCNDTNQQACNEAAEARMDSELFQAQSEDEKRRAERIIREYGTGETHMSGF